MNKYEEVVLPLVAVATVFLIIASVVNTFPNTAEVYDYIEAEMGVSIVSAIIDSPAVIISVEENEFYSLIIELNASVVYRRQYGLNRRYYVFNEPMTIAYAWSVTYADIGFIWKLMN